MCSIRLHFRFLCSLPVNPPAWGRERRVLCGIKRTSQRQWGNMTRNYCVFWCYHGEQWSISSPDALWWDSVMLWWERPHRTWKMRNKSVCWWRHFWNTHTHCHWQVGMMSEIIYVRTNPHINIKTCFYTKHAASQHNYTRLFICKLSHVEHV